MFFYNDNFGKCKASGDYILISDKNKSYVIRQYRDYASNVKLEVLDPEVTDDMSILESDAPEVCESIKKLSLK